VLLDNVLNVTLNPGEKVGLVGRNGAGKSSLFALLNGRCTKTAAISDIPRSWRMAQVAQNMPETDEPATDFVLQGDTRLMAAARRTGGGRGRDDGHAMAHAYTDLARRRRLHAPCPAPRR
jgi:ATP-binding cassette subfamily F protein 3